MRGLALLALILTGTALADHCAVGASPARRHCPRRDTHTHTHRARERDNEVRQFFWVNYCQQVPHNASSPSQRPLDIETHSEKMYSTETIRVRQLNPTAPNIRVKQRDRRRFMSHNYSTSHREHHNTPTDHQTIASQSQCLNKPTFL